MLWTVPWAGFDVKTATSKASGERNGECSKTLVLFTEPLLHLICPPTYKDSCFTRLPRSFKHLPRSAAALDCVE
jgi:hypothetical protein